MNLRIEKRFGTFDVDLFATNLNIKCKKFVSWFRDPESFATDAFTISWKSKYFYPFPPFSLILRALTKIIDDKAEGLLVVPLWPAQTWYSLFLELLLEEPLYLFPKIDLLACPFRKAHSLARNLTLVRGKLSAKLFGAEAHRNQG